MRGESFTNLKIQFDLVYAEGRSWAGKEIVLRALPNKLNSSRFGFVASRRVGKAVVRNLIKRRLREIVRHAPVRSGWDIILIARVPAAVTSYKILGESVGKLLSRAGLFVKDNEGNSPGLN